MRCQHRTSWECYCVCVGLQKYTCFENIFVLHYQEITENVELTKKATCKPSAILCRRYNNCLDLANLYSRSVKPSIELVCFKDLE